MNSVMSKIDDSGMSDQVDTWNTIVDDSDFVAKKQEKKIGSSVNDTEPAVIKPNEPNKINQTYDEFETMNLKMNLLRGLYAYGFEKPALIQQFTIPVIISGQDLRAQSQSGTGKTGSFVTGILQRINEHNNYPQAIIMAPTRELSQQIETVTLNIGNFMKIKTCLCIGGTSVSQNIEDVKTSHIVIGTPGRINDLIDRNAFDIGNIIIFTMDEADELLGREFVTQTRNIVKRLNTTTQICVFSATLQENSVLMTNKFMSKPVDRFIEREKLSLDLILQFYIDAIEEKYKIECLNDLYEKLSIGQCIIYVNYKDKAIWLQEQLAVNGHSCEAIHGSLLPAERSEIMKKFRNGICRVLVSTDLLARGIDVQQVGYVINYDLPIDLDNYLHRIGRSGRYGKKGVAINFITRRDMRQFKTLKEYYSIKIEEMPEPTALNTYLTTAT